MFVKLDKPEFVGKEALARQKAEGVKRRIVGLELEGNAIPRHGYPVEMNGEQIGEITTGYRSISTGRSVAMAMINKPYDKLGTEVEVRIRKKTFPAKVVKKTLLRQELQEIILPLASVRNLPQLLKIQGK